MSTTIRQNVFLPTQISGCTLWLDGADTSSMILSGSTITTWKDKSSLSNNATSSTSPQYIATGGVAFGGTAYFGISSPYSYTCTVFMVASGVNNTVSGRYYWNYNQVNYGAVVYNANVNLGGPLGYYHNAAGGQVGATIVAGTLVSPFLVSLTENVAGNSALGYFNGTQAYSVTCATGPATTITEIGGSAVNGALSGNIYELIFFNSVLPSSQRQQVEGYLAQKWGLQANLPPNHPYRYSAYFTNQPYMSTILSQAITNRFTNGSFLPTQIPACSLWLDGADPAGTGVPPASGATVSTWNDKSTTGNNFTGNATYAFDSVYNRYGLSFDGTNNYFVQANGSLYSITNTTYCIFTVHRFTTNGSPSTAYEVYRTYVPNPGSFFRQVNGAVQWITDLDPAGYITVTASGAANSGIGCINSLTTTTVNAYLNGTSVGSAAKGSSTNFTFAIGQTQGANNERLLGAIFEMIIYNTTLTTTQRQQVEGYLAWKWGLNASLPPTHPYKNTSAVFVTQPSTLAAFAANPYNNMTVYRTFNPKSIAGCVLWLDGKDTSSASMTLSGTTVKVWKDKSGNGYNASEGNASYPASSVGSGVVFPVINTYFALSSPFSSTHTVFIVATTSSASSIYLFGRSFPGGGPTILLNYVGVSLEYYDNSSSGRQTLATTPTSTYIASYIRTLDTSVVGRYNGSQSFTEAGPPSPDPQNSTAWGSLGCSAPVYGNWYTGTMYEFFIYNASLTTSQSQQVEGYLAWKWGLVANLPATHPYKSFPPPP